MSYAQIAIDFRSMVLLDQFWTRRIDPEKFCLVDFYHRWWKKEYVRARWLRLPDSRNFDEVYTLVNSRSSLIWWRFIFVFYWRFFILSCPFDCFQPPPNPNRYAILSTRLLHSNLSVIHYSVFFQMCRAHGIGFDMKVITCYAGLSSSFDTFYTDTFYSALQYAMPCSVCLFDVHSDGIFFSSCQKVKFPDATWIKASGDSQVEVKSEDTKSICYFNWWSDCNLCLFSGKSWHNFYFGGQFETRTFRNVVSGPACYFLWLYQLN